MIDENLDEDIAIEYLNANDDYVKKSNSKHFWEWEKPFDKLSYFITKNLNVAYSIEKYREKSNSVTDKLNLSIKSHDTLLNTIKSMLTLYLDQLKMLELISQVVSKEKQHLMILENFNRIELLKLNSCFNLSFDVNKQISASFKAQCLGICMIYENKIISIMDDFSKILNSCAPQEYKDKIIEYINKKIELNKQDFDYHDIKTNLGIISTTEEIRTQCTNLSDIACLIVSFSGIFEYIEESLFTISCSGNVEIVADNMKELNHLFEKKIHFLESIYYKIAYESEKSIQIKYRKLLSKPNLSELKILILINECIKECFSLYTCAIELSLLNVCVFSFGRLIIPPETSEEKNQMVQIISKLTKLVQKYAYNLEKKINENKGKMSMDNLKEKKNILKDLINHNHVNFLIKLNFKKIDTIYNTEQLKFLVAECNDIIKDLNEYLKLTKNETDDFNTQEKLSGLSDINKEIKDQITFTTKLKLTLDSLNANIEKQKTVMEKIKAFEMKNNMDSVPDFHKYTNSIRIWKKLRITGYNHYNSLNEIIKESFKNMDDYLIKIKNSIEEFEHISNKYNEFSNIFNNKNLENIENNLLESEKELNIQEINNLYTLMDDSVKTGLVGDKKKTANKSCFYTCLLLPWRRNKS